MLTLQWYSSQSKPYSFRKATLENVHPTDQWNLRKRTQAEISAEAARKAREHAAEKANAIERRVAELEQAELVKTARARAWAMVKANYTAEEQLAWNKLLGSKTALFDLAIEACVEGVREDIFKRARKEIEHGNEGSDEGGDGEDDEGDQEDNESGIEDGDEEGKSAAPPKVRSQHLNCKMTC